MDEHGARNVIRINFNKFLKGCFAIQYITSYLIEHLYPVKIKIEMYVLEIVVVEGSGGVIDEEKYESYYHWLR